MTVNGKDWMKIHVSIYVSHVDIDYEMYIILQKGGSSRWFDEL